MVRNVLAPLALLATLSSPAVALDGPDIYQRVRPSMVQVIGVTAQGRYDFGSGVSLPNGTVVTNCHVTRRATSVQTFPAARAGAQLQAADVVHDLCALYFPEQTRPAVELGVSRGLRLGDRVYALGFNAGHGLSYQPGEIAELFMHDGAMVIRTTAPFTHGASGGGLFDDRGRLVGILTFLRPAPGGTDYYAVPVEWLAALESAPAQAVAPLEGTPFWAEVAERQPTFLRAGALAADRRWEDLAAVARQWTESDPTDGQAWMALGRANAELGQTGDADAAFRRAAELGVGQPDPK
jgi:hypothetical protein